MSSIFAKKYLSTLVSLKLKEKDSLKDVINKIRSFLFSALLIVYVIISIISLENCTTKQEYSSTSDQLNQKKVEAVKIFLNEFDAQAFNFATKDIFRKSIVLDTTLLGISRKDGNVFLSARVNGSSLQKYFVKLKCSRDIVEQFNKTKSNNAIIAAKISRIDNEKIIATADSLDGADTSIYLGETILLSGECLAIKEL